MKGLQTYLIGHEAPPTGIRSLPLMKGRRLHKSAARTSTAQAGHAINSAPCAALTNCLDVYGMAGLAPEDAAGLRLSVAGLILVPAIPMDAWNADMLGFKEFH